MPINSLTKYRHNTQRERERERKREERRRDSLPEKYAHRRGRHSRAFN